MSGLAPDQVTADQQAVAAALGAVERCPSCGATVREGQDWCGQCYAALRPAPEPVPEPAAETAARPMGDPAGSRVGLPVGSPVGSSVGSPVGDPVGDPLGDPLGAGPAAVVAESALGTEAFSAAGAVSGATPEALLVGGQAASPPAYTPLDDPRGGSAQPVPHGDGAPRRGRHRRASGDASGDAADGAFGGAFGEASREVSAEASPAPSPASGQRPVEAPTWTCRRCAEVAPITDLRCRVCGYSPLDETDSINGAVSRVAGPLRDPQKRVLLMVGGTVVMLGVLFLLFTLAGSVL